MISVDDVRHVASLARIELTDDEVFKFVGQISDVLNYVDQLADVDTDGVEPTFQLTGLENVTRGDDVESVCTKNEMLGCTELPVERDQILTKSVITEN